ncbi:MAG: potassium-transporting ATPase subunit A [Candidatus Hydrogenedentes bacterium]|nr:potassium-transporting ATPase subunit A [Candidatus Hydrogenedentota bacterium]
MDVLLITIFVAALVALSWPIGTMMAWAMAPESAETTFRGRLDRLLIRMGGSLLRTPHGWKTYCYTLLLVNAGMFVLVFAVLALQQVLPLNPDGKGALEGSLIFNTAASFTSNTNLQHYSGEVSLSYFSQIFGLMWLQFVSAATGIAALAALARGLAGNPKIGNFYLDFLRATFLVLLPIALIVACALALLGVPMTFEGAAVAQTLEGATQTIARGPVAAFVTIKQLGTNGGGFFGPNSTHPLENPGFWSNIIECMSILLIPMGAVWMFGRITRRMKHAAVIFCVMLLLLVTKMSLAVAFESQQTPAFAGQPVTDLGLNLEGKELRFGGAAGPVWAVATTATSNGSVNAMHDSLNPLTGLLPMIGMWLNVTFGGVGVGMINMFLYIIIGVFIAGMMVGRTPEYLTRKVETKEMTLALLALLIHPLFILGGTALFASTALGADTLNNPGSHGFSEILYEFSSAAANNGSGFEGLGDNTVSWNIATGLIMLLGRYLPIILPLAIAGSLAAKKPTPETIGTLHTDRPLFGFVLLGSVVLVGALLFLPVAVLGPVAEHLGNMQ